MLEYSTNYEQMLDEVLAKALPYLIFSPPEFSTKLAKSMAGLWQAYENRHSGNVAFLQNVEAVSQMLDNPECAWDPGIAQRIRSFERERMSWWMRIRAVERDVTTLKVQFEELSKRAGKKAEKPVKIVPFTPQTSQLQNTEKVNDQVSADVSKPVIPVQSNDGDSRTLTITIPEGKYSDELIKFKMMLETRSDRELSNSTIRKYIGFAGKTLEKYHGVLPSEEKYRAELESQGLKKSAINDHVSILRHLKKSVEM